MTEKKLGTMEAPQLLKKISVKTVVGNVRTLFPKSFDADASPESGLSHRKGDPIPGQTARCMQVFGVVSGIRSGTTAYGPWDALVGDIRVQNLINGEVSRGKELLLPEIVADFIVPIAKTAVKDGVPMEVAFEIGVISTASAKGPGHQYTASPLMEMGKADESPAAKLMLALGAGKPLAIANDVGTGPKDGSGDSAQTATASTTQSETAASAAGTAGTAKATAKPK